MHTEKIKLIRPHIQIKKSDVHRFGVFATKNFAKGEIIEECPILILDDTICSPILENYVFDLNSSKKVLALGYGSIYNHSNEPNVKITMSQENEFITVYANRLIFKGEELFINYTSAWFTDRNLEIRKPKKTYTKRKG